MACIVGRIVEWRDSVDHRSIGRHALPVSRIEGPARHCTAPLCGKIRTFNPFSVADGSDLVLLGRGSTLMNLSLNLWYRHL